MKNLKILVVSGVLGSIMLVLGMTRLGFIPVGPVYATTLHIPVIIGAIFFGKRVGLITGAFFGIYSLVNAYINPTVISFMFQNPLLSVVPRVIFALATHYIFKILTRLGEKKQKKMLNAIFVILILLSSYSLYMAIMRENPKTISIIIPIFMIVMSILLFVLNIKHENKIGAYSAAAFIGSYINTLIVVTLMYVIYLKSYSVAMGVDVEKARTLLLGIAIFHGLPEAVMASIITGALSLRRRFYDFSS